MCTLPECPPCLLKKTGLLHLYPLVCMFSITSPHPRPGRWLGDVPVSGPCSPEHREACQGVSQVGVERRQGEAAQAPQLPEGGPVVVLHTVIDQAQGRQQEQQPGQTRTQDSKEAQQAYRIGQQDVEEEGQAVIHTGYV